MTGPPKATQLGSPMLEFKARDSRSGSRSRILAQCLWEQPVLCWRLRDKTQPPRTKGLSQVPRGRGAEHPRVSSQDQDSSGERASADPDALQGHLPLLLPTHGAPLLLRAEVLSTPSLGLSARLRAYHPSVCPSKPQILTEHSLPTGASTGTGDGANAGTQTPPAWGQGHPWSEMSAKEQCGPVAKEGHGDGVKGQHPRDDLKAEGELTYTSGR